MPCFASIITLWSNIGFCAPWLFESTQIGFLSLVFFSRQPSGWRASASADGPQWEISSGMGELIKVVSEEEEGEEEARRHVRRVVGGRDVGRAISRASIVTLLAPITNCRNGAHDGRSTTHHVGLESCSESRPR